MVSGQPDHTKVTLMKGTDPSGNLVTIAVDADGNMIGVMKGEYEGTLKTLATDADGRIVSLLADPEDIWGNVLKIGNAELAARLGSIVTFDRRGQVYWFDDFSAGLAAWQQSTAGTGASIKLSTERFHRGPYSAKLTSGSQLTNNAMIYRGEPYPTLSNLGYEFSANLDSNCSLLGPRAVFYDGTDRHIMALRYDHPNTKLELLVEGNTWSTIDSSIELSVVQSLFHNFKLVANLTTDTYIRFLLDGVEYDLSAYSLHTAADAEKPYLYHRVFVQSQQGTNAVAYVDDVILTTQEP